MKSFKIISPLLFALIFTSLNISINAQNSEPLVSPFKGSSTLGTHEARFSRLTLLVGPLDGKNPTTLEVEGALVSTIYERPDNVTPFEIFKSYEKILKEADFDILLACEEGKCNSKKNVKAIYGYPKKEIEDRKYNFTENKSSTQQWLVGWGNHYISAKKKTADKTYYVMIIVSNEKNLYSVDVLEVEGMEEGTVELAPALLKDKIESEGKVVLQGIYFETGKDIITDQSKPSLNVITSYLKENSNLKFYVVGHTDDTGNTESNISLSKKRADAVIAALKELGVDSSKLTGYGVGPFSPSASNKTESGKSDNRRVELVLRLN